MTSWSNGVPAWRSKRSMQVVAASPETPAASVYAEISSPNCASLMPKITVS